LQEDLIENIDFDELMLENSSPGIALFDAYEFRLLRINPAYYAISHQRTGLDWPNKEVIGLKLQDALSSYMPKPEIERTLSVFREVATTGIPFHANMQRTTSRDNSIIYWEFSLYPVRGNDGKIEQLVSTINDVTIYVEAFQQAERIQTRLSQKRDNMLIERQRLEVIETVARSVRESLDIKLAGQATINVIAENLQPLIANIHIDRPEQEVFELLHSYLAPHLTHIFSSLAEVSYESDLLIAKARFLHKPIIIEDVPLSVNMGILPVDHQLVTVASQAFACFPLWFQGHFEGTLSATFGTPISADGYQVKTLEGCAGYLAAGLALARLHAQVDHERARLRAVLDQLPECVMIVEAKDGTTSYLNAAAANIKELHMPTFIGQPASLFAQTYQVDEIDGQPRAHDNLLYIRALRGEIINGQETTVTLHDGIIMTILISAAPLRTKDGQISGAAIIFRDISSRKEIERQKNEFLQLASHELRTPITTIQGLAEILQMLDANSSIQELPRSLRAIEEIIEQSQRLIQLIDEMLDLTRIENEQLLLNYAHHDLLATVKEVLESHTITSLHHSIHLQLDGLVTSDTIDGYFDKERIKQALSNLITNALKFSPPGSEVEVGIRYNPDIPGEIVLWVKDAGVGISPGKLAHIFERFHHASNSESLSGRLGIGLYIVKELVARHKGRVWVESTPQAGSTFYVLLPLHVRESNISMTLK